MPSDRPLSPSGREAWGSLSNRPRQAEEQSEGDGAAGEKSEEERIVLRNKERTDKAWEFKKC